MVHALTAALAQARKIAERKGIGYQTLLKSLCARAGARNPQRPRTMSKNHMGSGLLFILAGGFGGIASLVFWLADGTRFPTHHNSRAVPLDRAGRLVRLRIAKSVLTALRKVPAEVQRYRAGPHQSM